MKAQIRIGNYRAFTFQKWSEGFSLCTSKIGKSEKLKNIKFRPNCATLINFSLHLKGVNSRRYRRVGGE